MSWRRTLRWYTLKYVWSAGRVQRRGVRQKEQSIRGAKHGRVGDGAPLNTWKTERIDLKAEFRKHFENGDLTASVPDFLGVGIMSDGDQTHSDSSADYADFVVER